MVTDIDHRDVGSLVSNLRRKALACRNEAAALEVISGFNEQRSHVRGKLIARADALEEAAEVVARWARRRGLRRPLR